MVKKLPQSLKLSFIFCTIFTLLFLMPLKVNAALMGDVNSDRKVDIVDIGIIIDSYGRTGCGTLGDINSDCKVDIIDIGIAIDNYGRTESVNPTSTPPVTSVGIGPINLTYRQGGIWLTPEEIAQIPTDNPGWESLVSWASRTPDLNDLQCTSGGACGESHSGRIIFAKAIVGMRTGNQTMINDAKAGLDRADEAINQFLGRNTDIKWGERNMPYLAVSANILNHRPPELLTAINKVIKVYVWPEGVTIANQAIKGLANKPAHGKWGTLALAYLQEDWTTVNNVVKAHAKFMGEPLWGGARNDHRLSLSGLGSEDGWQTLQPGGESDPIGIMPMGTTWNGHGVGGLYLADQYRAGNGPVWPPAYTNYTWEGFGPNISVSFAADHLGYKDVFKLGNYAVLRMVLFQYSTHDGKGRWTATGNDVWTVAAVMTWAKREFGGSLPANLKPEPDAQITWPIPVDAGGDPGRSMGFMYATHYARLAR